MVIYSADRVYANLNLGLCMGVGARDGTGSRFLTRDPTRPGR